jgi:hypothetical protein
MIPIDGLVMECHDDIKRRCNGSAMQHQHVVGSLLSLLLFSEYREWDNVMAAPEPVVCSFVSQEASIARFGRGAYWHMETKKNRVGGRRGRLERASGEHSITMSSEPMHNVLRWHSW